MNKIDRLTLLVSALLSSKPLSAGQKVIADAIAVALAIDKELMEATEAKENA